MSRDGFFRLMMTNPSAYAQIVVNTPLAIATPRSDEHSPAESLRERTFTYSIPASLAAQVVPGQLVWVSFGARRLQGLVVGLSDSSPVEETKEIEAVVDPRPFLTPAQIDLARWIAATYLCSLNDALQLMLPAGIEQHTETMVQLVPGAATGEFTPKQAALVNLLTREGEMRASRIPRELRGTVDVLARHGIVVRRTFLAPPRVKPKRVQSVRLIADQGRIDAALASLIKRNPQADILDYLARHATGPWTVEEICASVRCSQASLVSLQRQAAVEVIPAQESISLTPKYYDELPALSPTQALTLVYLREHGTPLAISELKSILKTSGGTLHALEQSGYIERTCTPPMVILKLTPTEAQARALQMRGAEKYHAIVDFLRREQGAVWVSGLYAATDCTRHDLDRLAASGIVALEEQETWRDSLAGREFVAATPPRLTPEQMAALEQIVSKLHAEVPPESRPERPALLRKPVVFLLHGVTGSGKTEIYLSALERTIRLGRQGIVLVPEISLTPQTIRRFGARFPRIAVLHSRLGEGERYDTWRRCRDGLIDIVIGSRSALFAPLPNLGLIVLDEEHEPAYKQEATPHYHARAVALAMAERLGCAVVLGSATPDLETYYRAAHGEFQLLELPQRIMGHGEQTQKGGDGSHSAKPTRSPLCSGKAESKRSEPSGDPVIDLAISSGAYSAESPDPALFAGQEAESKAPPVMSERTTQYLELPPVQVVDLRAELKTGNRSIFSRALQYEMTRALAAREQIILFLNRRGSATFILCRDCGYVSRCRRCDNPMTFHAASDQLICHHCNRRERVPAKCPSCGSTRIRYFGIGTQRVELECKAMFPQARLLRWDFDATRGKGSHETILEEFVEHRADILIGTQMIAKGLDLPKVTLVGVVSADTALNLPDFRAGERTFQLLTQVAGRAGRSALGGKVIVQTYNPGHYAIQAASHHDYRTFYEREIQFRREQDYPPFSRLIRLLYTDTNVRRAQGAAEELRKLLATRIAQRGLVLDLVGPAPAFFHRLRGEYRYHILIRGRNPHELLADMALPLGWRVDVDPVSVL